MNNDSNVPFLKVKSSQLGPAGNSASYRKRSVIGSPDAGFQAFLTTLERGGHRFKPTTHVLNTGLSLTKQKTLAK